MTEIVRLNINLNRETADLLQRIATEHGMSMTEVIRRSVSLYGFVIDEIQAGRTVSTGSGHQWRQLVLL